MLTSKCLDKCLEQQLNYQFEIRSIWANDIVVSHPGIFVIHVVTMLFVVLLCYSVEDRNLVQEQMQSRALWSISAAIIITIKVNSKSATSHLKQGHPPETKVKTRTWWKGWASILHETPGSDQHLASLNWKSLRPWIMLFNTQNKPDFDTLMPSSSTLT